MRLTLLEFALFAAAAAIAASVLVRCSSSQRVAIVAASWTRTPGVLNPAVTQATIGATICRRGWTRTIRPPVSYTNDLKRRQLREYGLRGPPSAYQEDHLVSLELGRLGTP
jgi:hypothetical protein